MACEQRGTTTWTKNQQLKIKGKVRNIEAIKKTTTFFSSIEYFITFAAVVPLYTHTRTCTHKFWFCCARVLLFLRLLFCLNYYYLLHCSECVCVCRGCFCAVPFFVLSHFTFGYPSPSILCCCFFFGCVYECAKHMHSFCLHMCHSCRSTVYRAIKAKKKAAATTVAVRTNRFRAKSSQQCIEYWYCCMLRNWIYYLYCIAATRLLFARALPMLAVISGEKNTHTHTCTPLPEIGNVSNSHSNILHRNRESICGTLSLFSVCHYYHRVRFTLDCVKNSKVISYTP